MLKSLIKKEIALAVKRLKDFTGNTYYKVESLHSLEGRSVSG